MNCGCPDTSCPSPVGVTITQNVLSFGDNILYSHEARFSRAAGTVVAAFGRYTRMDLPYAPLSPEDVFVFGNSGAMRGGGIDYVVSGSQVYLVNEAAVDSEYMIKWKSLSGTDAATGAGTVWATGSLQPFAADPGTGWLPMKAIADGGAAHSKAAYAALWTYLAINTALTLSPPYAGSTFELKTLTAPVYTGAALEYLQMYIRT